MRTVTIEKRVGNFSELSEDLQEKVIAHFRENDTFTYYDYEWIIEDFCNEMEKSGLHVSPKNVNFSGFYSQGDGSSFSGKVTNLGKFIFPYADTYKKTVFLSEKDFKRFCRWAKHVFYECDCDIEIRGSERYYTVRANIDIFTEVYENDHVKRMSAENEARYLPILERIVEERAIDENFNLYKRLEQEYDRVMSEAYIKENIEANGIEFNLETGEVF